MPFSLRRKFKGNLKSSVQPIPVVIPPPPPTPPAAMESSSPPPQSSQGDFIFLRSDTAGQQPVDEWPLKNSAPIQTDRRSFARSGASTPTSPITSTAPKHHSFLATDPEKLDRRSIRKSRGSPIRPRKDEEAGGLKRSFSQKLHLGPRTSRPRALSSLSAHLPETLPDTLPDSTGTPDDRESKWEKRATLLVQASPSLLSDDGSSSFAQLAASPEQRGRQTLQVEGATRSRTRSTSSAPADIDIQEAIRLHEAEQYERSTAMFRHLADPSGSNNALAQVLYGLALRHGWGIKQDPALAIGYLSAAAKNSAKVEELALKAGMKKGGAAKGELVLAIYELANCFRNGWGVDKDPVAAMQYYLTAANLGDTDSMNEVAMCYLKGFGCKKDKPKAALYYRMAEKKGHKTLGNSWIWKEKYDPKT